MKAKIRMALVLLLVVVICALIWYYLSGSRKIQRVVLISIDTCRADHLSCYGYKQNTTPNIDAVAAEGVLFKSVVAPVPLTFPSHLTMLTGTIPPRHGSHDNLARRTPDSNITIAETLRDNGYKTGAFVSSFVLDPKFGLDQGFETYSCYSDMSVGLKKLISVRLAGRKQG